MIDCAQCNTSINEEANFCAACGHQVRSAQLDPEANYVSADTQPGGSSNSNAKPLIVGALLLLFGAGAAAYLNRDVGAAPASAIPDGNTLPIEQTAASQTKQSSASNNNENYAEFSQIILNTNEVQQRRSTIHLRNGGYRSAYDIGLMINDRGASYMSEDFKREASMINNGHLIALTPVQIDIEVTSVSEFGDPSTKTVQFNWRYRNLSPLIAMVAGRGGTGEASLRRFDTGWQASVLRTEPDRTAYVLDSATTAQLAARAQKTQNDEAGLQRDLVASLKEGKVSWTTTFPHPQFRQHNQNISITEAGITYMDHMVSEDKIWFGHVLSYKISDNVISIQKYNGWVNIRLGDSGENYRTFEQAFTVAYENWRKKYSHVGQKYARMHASEISSAGF